MERKRKRTKMITLTIASIVLLALATDFLMVRKAALNRFAVYEAKAETINSSYGKVSYIDEGQGEAFLVFHGITGGHLMAGNSEEINRVLDEFVEKNR